MSILSNFYTTEIVTDPRYKFSSSGLYYAPPKGSYESYVDFIKELPMTQLPDLFYNTAESAKSQLSQKKKKNIKIIAV